MNIEALAHCYDDSLVHILDTVRCAAYSTDCTGRVIDTAAPLFLAYMHYKHVRASLKSREVSRIGSPNYVPVLVNIMFALLAGVGVCTYMNSLETVADVILSSSRQLVISANETSAYIQGMVDPVSQSMNFNHYVSQNTNASGGVKIALVAFTLYSTACLIYKNFEAGKNPFKIYPIKLIVILVSSVALIIFSIFQIVLGNKSNPSGHYMNEIDYCNSLA